MSKTIKFLGFLTLIFTGQFSFGQTNKEQALAKAKEAIKLEDEQGKYDEAIKLFAEAQALDPENIIYPYEMAYAYSGKKEYKKASEILEKLLNHKDVYGRVYQALGNAYDYQGKADKAIETYEKGIKMFPNSGELYLELGNMKIAKKDYSNALTYYEKGIENDPRFPSNYYWASKIFCNSDEEVWGMLYGEIFMNLERNSNRTGEISKLLFDTYKSEIKFTSDTSFGISFSKNATMSIDDLKDPQKLKLPFGMGCYEMVLMMSVLGDKQIDINSLDRIRDRFVDGYFKGDNSKNYPNILFDYQQKIKNAGHFEAYNHWLLMKGDEEGFAKWQKDNKIKWNDFIKWYSENKIQLDLTHKFYRGQY
ncbi:MAG TPA: tetratricopeptide repeat protein [Chitinophagaceae bacterium]|nr:tetratricopeptide repeat protein [Chitinophagaceae bacterium]